MTQVDAEVRPSEAWLLVAPMLTLTAVVMPGVIVGWLPRIGQGLVFAVLTVASIASLLIAARRLEGSRRAWLPKTAIVTGAVAVVGALTWTGLTLQGILLGAL